MERASQPGFFDLRAMSTRNARRPMHDTGALPRPNGGRSMNAHLTAGRPYDGPRGLLLINGHLHDRSGSLERAPAASSAIWSAAHSTCACRQLPMPERWGRRRGLPPRGGLTLAERAGGCSHAAALRTSSHAPFLFPQLNPADPQSAGRARSVARFCIPRSRARWQSDRRGASTMMPTRFAGVCLMW